MEVRPAVEADRPVLASFAARLQARPNRHIAYLGVEADGIAEEIASEDDDWTAVSAVGERDGELAGWIVGSVDAEMGRVWWFGPFVDDSVDSAAWGEAVTAIYGFASRLLPDGVSEEELAPDDRFERLARWAREHGFHADDEPSAVLVLDGPIEPPSIAVRSATAADRDWLAPLHDRLFPRTHTTGAALVDGADADHLRLVAVDDEGPVGYVAVERQPDGCGYIDFLGVPADRRRRGAGSELVRAGVTELRRIGCGRIALTVRAGNRAARALYEGLGFDEERVIRPLRKGFSLP